jgi:hypothetical protein
MHIPDENMPVYYTVGKYHTDDVDTGIRVTIGVNAYAPNISVKTRAIIGLIYRKTQDRMVHLVQSNVLSPDGDEGCLLAVDYSVGRDNFCLLVRGFSSLPLSASLLYKFAFEENPELRMAERLPGFRLQTSGSRLEVITYEDQECTDLGLRPKQN